MPIAVTAEIFVNSTRIVRGGVAGASGDGVFIKPTGSGSANVFIEESSLTDNDTGLSADITTTSGFVSVTLMNSVVTGNRIGVATVGDAGGVHQVTISRSIISGAVTGLCAVSPGVVSACSGVGTGCRNLRECGRNR